MSDLLCQPASKEHFKSLSKDNYNRLVDLCGTDLNTGAAFIYLGNTNGSIGSSSNSLAEEEESLLELLTVLAKAFPQGLFVAESKTNATTRAALQAGASIISCPSSAALSTDFASTDSALSIPVLLTFSTGDIQAVPTIQNEDEPMVAAFKALQASSNRLRLQGVKDVLVDPGLSQLSNTKEMLTFLNRFSEFSFLNRPVVASCGSIDERSLSLSSGRNITSTSVVNFNMLALMGGANILRTVNVASAIETIDVYNELHAISSFNNSKEERR